MFNFKIIIVHYYIIDLFFDIVVISFIKEIPERSLVG